MIRKPISFKVGLLYSLASVVILILGYAWLSHRQHEVNPLDTTIPNLSQFIKGVKLLTHKDSLGEVWLLNDFLATGKRLSLGLGVGVALSFLIGLFMGVHLPTEAFFKWPVTFLGKIPPTAMLAVYFVLFGTEMEMYVAMIALGILPSITMAIYMAARKDVSDHAIYKAYTLGASSLEVILEVVVRQIFPRVVENIRLVVGPALVFLIAAEWMMADVGFGYRLRIQSRLLNMNVVYIYLMLLGSAGFIMDWALVKFRRKMSPWFDSTR